MRIIGLCLISLVIAYSNAFAESETVFSGVPMTKISEGGISRVSQELDRKDAITPVCVISKTEGKYYWTTRENKEMNRSLSGAFETYIAVDGSGYVRAIRPKMKEAASLMDKTEKKYDYVEHLLIGLRSVTYYGVRKQ
jgi:hypothetical protein